MWTFLWVQELMSRYRSVLANISMTCNAVLENPPTHICEEDYKVMGYSMCKDIVKIFDYLILSES